MRGSARSDAAHANGSAGEELNTVRAFDCVDPMHEEAHFTSETDAVLTEKVLRHFAEYHPDVAEEAVRQMVGTRAYVEASTSGEDDG
jgi:hypothetical protein